VVAFAVIPTGLWRPVMRFSLVQINFIRRSNSYRGWGKVDKREMSGRLAEGGSSELWRTCEEGCGGGVKDLGKTKGQKKEGEKVGG